MNIKDYKYKIETHAHTSPMSPCARLKPEDVIRKYAEIGFSAIAITNHFSNGVFAGDSKETVKKRFLSDFFASCEAGKKHGLKVILGMEIRFPQNANDYLVYGFGEDDIDLMFDLSFTDCATFYKEFKNDKNVILQAHPFRDGMVRYDPKYLDGIETFNMHLGHNPRIGDALIYAKEHPHFITTCGTDFHYDTHQGLGGIITKTIPTNSFELADILKSRDYLFNVAGSIVIP